ncbi:MAG: hypothetical protein COV35_05475 [Alphaproteobacteria bacterium CG11_big_fil_rev_8_21_14_0_20_39_49]|nr:MAG: hypothetical protein COV35_05475 [Alphaproteobacteria bacterium CG11_big_fil_rev_8_21_14_0_20_39_49]
MKLHLSKACIAFGLATLCCTTSAHAQEVSLQEIIKEVQMLKAKQEHLEAENKQLKSEIHALRDTSSRKVSGTEQHSGETTSTSEVAQTIPGNAELTQKTSAATNVGYQPGRGFYIEGEDASLRVMSYIQAVAAFQDGGLGRADGNGDFSVRRARLDFLVDMYDDFQFFLEFDGGPGTANVGDSEFAFVEGRLNWKILEDDLQLRMGKFTSQFSTENARSSRSIDTIERYMALNSMFLLPALDVQFGTMLHGNLGEENRLSYSLGVYNGNGRANDNLSDDNNSKEVQAKLGYKFTDNFEASVALDYSDEELQTLSLADLGFNRYISVPIEGERFGVGGDIYWHDGPYSFRSELLAASFDTPTGDNANLYGGFVQPAYFFFGDENKGLQGLIRAEFAHLDGDTGNNGDTIYATTLGTNWFLNPSVRWQVNAIAHYFDGASALQGFDDERIVPMLMTEMQFKF